MLQLLMTQMAECLQPWSLKCFAVQPGQPPGAIIEAQLESIKSVCENSLNGDSTVEPIISFKGKEMDL